MDNQFATELTTAIFKLRWWKDPEDPMERTIHALLRAAPEDFDNDSTWSCTWRRSTDIVTSLRNPDLEEVDSTFPDYLDWYIMPTHPVNQLSERIVVELSKIGWHPIAYPKEYIF